MGLLIDVLTLPVLGAPRLVHWIGGKVSETADQEVLDEDRVLGQLLELQEAYERGELTEDQLESDEEILINELRDIREAKRLKEEEKRRR